MTTRATPKQQRGFTLIEVLVTMTLMSLVSLLAWQALDTTGRSITHAQEISNDSTAIVRTLDQIADDLVRHALLESPYPDRFGQMRKADAPALPPSITWSGNQLTILQLDHAGVLTPIYWKLEHGVLSRASSSHAPEPAMKDVARLNIAAWVRGRGWIDPADIPAGLRASGLEVMIEQHARGDQASPPFRKVVMLP